MKKGLIGFCIGVVLALLVITVVELSGNVKAEDSGYTACDKAADGTAYVIEDNQVVKTFTTEECAK